MSTYTDPLSLPLASSQLVGLVDDVGPATWRGEQRTTRAGVPLWRVTLLVRLPGARSRRALDFLVESPDRPDLNVDAPAAPISPVVNIYEIPDRGLVTSIRAESVQHVERATLPKRPGGTA
jgi:hypothetical protein